MGDVTRHVAYITRGDLLHLTSLSATILANEVYVDVPHLQSSTPSLSDVNVSPNSNLGNAGWWVDTVTSTTIRINITGAQFSDVSFAVHIFS